MPSLKDKTVLVIGRGSGITQRSADGTHVFALESTRTVLA